MQIVIYILSSLLLSGFLYFLFAAYMTVAAGVSNLPIINFLCTILIFGFASWFHFFQPKSGSIILAVLVIVSFVTMPMSLMIDYFDGGDYTPGMIEFMVPLVLSLTILGLIFYRKTEMKKQWTKIILAVIPCSLGLYVGCHFIFKIIF